MQLKIKSRDFFLNYIEYLLNNLIIHIESKGLKNINEIINLNLFNIFNSILNIFITIINIINFILYSEFQN